MEQKEGFDIVVNDGDAGESKSVGLMGGGERVFVSAAYGLDDLCREPEHAESIPALLGHAAGNVATWKCCSA